MIAGNVTRAIRIPATIEIPDRMVEIVRRVAPAGLNLTDDQWLIRLRFQICLKYPLNMFEMTAVIRFVVSYFCYCPKPNQQI